jgi:hypothetical protein
MTAENCTFYPKLVPKREPINAVAAIATAPQNVTRKTAFAIGALPARAPTAPSIARKTKAAPEMIQLSIAPEKNGTIKIGSSAPTAKAPAEAIAA